MVPQRKLTFAPATVKRTHTGDESRIDFILSAYFSLVIRNHPPLTECKYSGTAKDTSRRVEKDSLVDVVHGRLCPCTTQHMAAFARKHTSNDTHEHKHTYTHTHTGLPSRSSYTSLFSTVACAHGESFVEVIGWVYTGRCWILFAEDSDKRPSTSFPLATSRRLPATVPTPCAISPSPRHLRLFHLLFLHLSLPVPLPCKAS